MPVAPAGPSRTPSRSWPASARSCCRSPSCPWSPPWSIFGDSIFDGGSEPDRPDQGRPPPARYRGRRDPDGGRRDRRDGCSTPGPARASTYAGWWRRLQPMLTPGGQEAYAYTDPAQVPGSRTSRSTRSCCIPPAARRPSTSAPPRAASAWTCPVGHRRRLAGQPGRLPRRGVDVRMSRIRPSPLARRVGWVAAVRPRAGRAHPGDARLIAQAVAGRPPPTSMCAPARAPPCRPRCGSRRPPEASGSPKAAAAHEVATRGRELKVPARAQALAVAALLAGDLASGAVLCADFFRELAEIDCWRTLPPTIAIHRVLGTPDPFRLRAHLADRRSSCSRRSPSTSTPSRARSPRPDWPRPAATSPSPT